MRQPLRLSLAALYTGLPLFAFGCGGSTQDHSPTPPAIQQLVDSPRPPASYSLADTDCQDGSGAATLTGTTIYSWNGPSVQQQAVSFHAASGVNSLSDQAVNGTTWNDFYQRTCDFSLGPDHYCDDGSSGQEKYWVRASTGGSLRICKDQFQYPRTSYEGVALTSLYFIQQARDRYLQVTAGDQAKAPAPIALSVLPQFVTDYANYPVRHDPSGKVETLRTFITDNLAYFPDAQMIAVFPVRADDPDRGGYFWESGFVLGHEFGHHIDFTRHGHVLQSVGLRWDPRHHSYFDDVAFATFGTTSSDRAQAAGAEAEAFADMLGFYLTGADGLAISGVPMIGLDRNVLNGKFSGGQPKLLTLEGLDSLLTGTQADSDEPNYADIHIVGAVIAHTADLVFGELTAAEPNLTPRSAEENDRRYHLTLQFMDSLVQATSALSATDTGAAVLAPVGQALQDAAEQYLTAHPPSGSSSAASIQAAVCTTVQTQMPALTSFPFAKNGHC